MNNSSVGARKLQKPAGSKAAKEKTASPEASSQAPAAPRATRKRAPKDLALQYGEKARAPRVAPKQDAPRKRRNAASRAREREVIAPDEGLLSRLARAGAISKPSVTSTGSNDAPDAANTRTRRSRKWEARCGKCGVSAAYSTPAALCVGCGTILMRE